MGLLPSSPLPDTLGQTLQHLSDHDPHILQLCLQLVHSHAPLAEVEREWEVGMRLNQLAEVNGSLPGFMGVGAGDPTECLPRLLPASFCAR